MRILALEPYDGGSHRAFLDGWIAHSRHRWTRLTLPPRHWKWRMRHAAITFAAEAAARSAAGQSWEALVCTSMLDLAGFRGLADPATARLPAGIYFHENQLTYPARRGDVRDAHFIVTHLTSILSAQGVWFNSRYHLETFAGALEAWLRRLPDHPPREALDRLQSLGRVLPPGIDLPPPRGPREPGPLRIAWVGRWEHDKNPEAFFEALRLLAAGETPFRLIVLGESFRDAPPVFAEARADLADHIEHWGTAPTREQYQALLRRADVVVSTARHEFFGIAVAEAVAAGALPVVPDDLAYPELLAGLPESLRPLCFCDPQPRALCRRLQELSDEGLCQWDAAALQRSMARFAWPSAAAALDSAVDALSA